MHESNGLDIIISLVLNEIRPLADENMDLALEIKVIFKFDFFTFAKFTLFRATLLNYC